MYHLGNFASGSSPIARCFRQKCPCLPSAHRPLPLSRALLLALVATHQFTQAEELVSNMEFDRSRRSDVGRSVLAIRRNDWSIACEAQQNWSSPEQFASQLQIMLKQIEWMENNVPLEDGFLYSKCRNPKQSQ